MLVINLLSFGKHHLVASMLAKLGPYIFQRFFSYDFHRDMSERTGLAYLFGLTSLLKLLILVEISREFNFTDIATLTSRQDYNVEPLAICSVIFCKKWRMSQSWARYTCLLLRWGARRSIHVGSPICARRFSFVLVPFKRDLVGWGWANVHFGSTIRVRRCSFVLFLLKRDLARSGINIWHPRILERWLPTSDIFLRAGPLGLYCDAILHAYSIAHLDGYQIFRYRFIIWLELELFVRSDHVFTA